LKPCCAHVCGVQVVPQTPALPFAPHDSPAGQVPHWSIPPQPSPAGPHEMFCCAHVT
jgi:hypothetical protein